MATARDWLHVLPQPEATPTVARAATILEQASAAFDASQSGPHAHRAVALGLAALARAVIHAADTGDEEGLLNPTLALGRKMGMDAEAWAAADRHAERLRAGGRRRRKDDPKEVFAHYVKLNGGLHVRARYGTVAETRRGARALGARAMSAAHRARKNSRKGT